MTRPGLLIDIKTGTLPCGGWRTWHVEQSLQAPIDLYQPPDGRKFCGDSTEFKAPRHHNRFSNTH